MSVKVTLLVENTVQRRGLLAEHGLSYAIDFGGRRVLFDTGQTPAVLASNAARLGWSLAEVEAVVLSHGHFDHTGGLPAVLAAAPEARVYLHPAALAPKFQQVEGKIGDYSTTPESLAALNQHRGHITSTAGVVEVVPGLFATGEIPRTNDYETTGGAFYLDAEGLTIDPIIDDQSLFFRSAEGIVIILGCSHAGVVNTVDYILSLHPGEPLAAVVGGMHLWKTSGEHRRRVGAQLLSRKPKLLAGCHCAGPLHELLPPGTTGVQLAQPFVGSSFSWTLPAGA